MPFLTCYKEDDSAFHLVVTSFLAHSIELQGTMETVFGMVLPSIVDTVEIYTPFDT